MTPVRDRAPRRSSPTGRCPSTDLTEQDRWPELLKAVAPLEIRAVLGVPVRLGAITIGTLDVYRNRAHQWDDSEQRALNRYADLVETTLTTAG